MRLFLETYFSSPFTTIPTLLHRASASSIDCVVNTAPLGVVILELIALLETLKKNNNSYGNLLNKYFAVFPSILTRKDDYFIFCYFTVNSEDFYENEFSLNLEAPTPQKCQRQSNNLLGTADGLFVYLTILCGWWLKD